MFLAFYRGRGSAFAHRVQEWAISTLTRSPYTHVEFVPTGQAAVPGREYPCLSASGRDGGVREKAIFLTADRWELIPVPWAPAGAEAAMRAQLGAGYDYAGIILSHMLGFNRQDSGRWFCSEIVAHALGLGRPYRYSPGDLRDVVLTANRAFHAGIARENIFGPVK